MQRSTDEPDVDWKDTDPNDTDIVTYSLAIFTCVCCCFTIAQHFLHWSNSRIQSLYVRLLLLPQIYALTSVAVVLQPKWGSFTEIATGGYEAYALYCFFALMIFHGKGMTHIIGNLDGKVNPESGVNEGLFHVGNICKMCCPPWKSSSFMMSLTKFALLQFMIVKPIEQLIAAILQSKDESKKIDSAILILRIIAFLSMFFAFYLLLNVFAVIKEQLKDFGGALKFLAIKGIVFTIVVQNLICSSLVKRGVIDEYDGASGEHRSERIQNVMVAIEMVPFALLFSYCFRYNDAPIGNFPPSHVSFSEKLIKCLSFYDFILNPLEPKDNLLETPKMEERL